MLQRDAKVDLFLRDTHVGVVTVQGKRDNWTFGRFEPNGAFRPFALVFSGWSMLLHEDEHEHLSRALSDELREAERRIDALRARLRVAETGQWLGTVEVNIDGPLIEWKEY